MSQALYRKWRPLHWDQVIGQDHIVQTLRNAVAADRIAHAYLFAGPRGTGKTTTARLLAKAVNCLEPELSARPCNQCEHCQAVNLGRFLDLIEIDAASNTSVDDVRDLRDKINFSPNQGRFKVYIVDEVHMLSTAAFNALLKTLEEPPPHALFVLATTEVHKIPPTVLSRCQRHEFRRIPVVDIVASLKSLAEEEGIQVEPEAVTLVARQATGAMRDAISLLDQLASTGKPVTLEMAQTVLGTATNQAVLEVVEALLAERSGEGLDAIHRALDAGSDPRQFARQIVDYLRNLLLVRMGNAAQVDTTTEMRTQMARHAQAFTVPGLLSVIQAFNYAAGEARAAWQPSLPLEMALVRSLSAANKSPEKAVGDSSGDSGEAALLEVPAASKKKRASQQPVRPVSIEESAPPEKIVVEEMSPADISTSQRLEENWRRVLSQVRAHNPNTYGLLNSCKSRALRGNVLNLGFASEVLKSQMEKSNNLEAVEGVLQEIMNMKISIRCHTVTGKRSTPPPDVDSDGMVASALRDLGGEIVDIQ